MEHCHLLLQPPLCFIQKISPAHQPVNLPIFADESGGNAYPVPAALDGNKLRFHESTSGANSEPLPNSPGPISVVISAPDTEFPDSADIPTKTISNRRIVLSPMGWILSAMCSVPT